MKTWLNCQITCHVSWKLPSGWHCVTVSSAGLYWLNLAIKIRIPWKGTFTSLLQINCSVGKQCLLGNISESFYIGNRVRVWQMAWVLAHLYAEQFFNGNDRMFLRADLIFRPDSDACDLSRVLLTPWLSSISSITFSSFTFLNKLILWRVLDFNSRREVVIYPPCLFTSIKFSIECWTASSSLSDLQDLEVKVFVNWVSLGVLPITR